MSLSSVRLETNITDPQLIRARPWLYTTTVLCGTGLISTSLAIFTLWRKLITEKTSFYIVIFTGTVLDLCFNISYLTYQWSDTSTLAYVLSCGFAFSTSLATDLCSLVLTVQRYLALKWPHLKLTQNRKSLIHLISAISIILISITRFQYIFDCEAVVFYIPAYFIHFYRYSVYMYIATGVNIILPFIFVIIVSFLSSQIILIITKRHQRKKIVPATKFDENHSTDGKCIDVDAIRREIATMPLERRFSHHRGILILNPPELEYINRPKSANAVVPILNVENVPKHHSAKVVTVDSVVHLVLLLDCLFMLNQVGYCVFTIVDLYSYYSNDSKMTLAERAFAEVVSDLCECLSHSLNFLFYLRFSKLMKMEFLDFLSRSKKQFLKLVKLAVRK